MHEVFKIKSSKPIPKTSVSKNEMHENEGLETYQVKKNLINLEKCLRKRFKGERRVFGR